MEKALRTESSDRLLLKELQSGRFLKPHRVRAWALVVLGIHVAAAIYFVAGTHDVFGPLPKPTSTDFLSFYASGTLARLGRATEVYDQARLYAMQESLRGHGVSEQLFFYPPIFLVLCAALARFPYLVSFYAFEVCSAAFYLLALTCLLGSRDRRWVLVAIAYPATFWAFGLGQNSFLTAGLFALGMLYLPSRPLIGGILLGCLSIKPHFGVLIPVALLASKNWFAIIGATLSVLALAGVATLSFGPDIWLAFVAMFHRAGNTFQDGRIPYSGLISVFAAAKTLGLSHNVAQWSQAASATLSFGCIARLWSARRVGPDVRAAALIAATLLAVPVVLFYDLLLAAVAAAFLIRDARKTGFLPYERVAYAGLFLVPDVSRPLAIAWHVSVGPMVVLALLALCWQRALASPAACTRDETKLPSEGLVSV